MKYANIIIDITHEKLDRTFQYIIPECLEEEIFPGVQVNVPFGKGNKIITGYVVEITDKSEYDIEKIKCIDGIVEGSIPIESQMIKMASWIKENYGSTMNKALKTVIPVSKKVKVITKDYVRLSSEKAAEELISKYENDKRMVGRLKLLKELQKEKELSVEIVTAKLQVSKNIIDALAKTDAITIRKEVCYRNPFQNLKKSDEIIPLNDIQKKVADSIICEMEKEDGVRTHLILGVTGSGKTEVYMNCIENVIAKGKQVIVLIPEISLTYQNIKRFYRRFGDTVSIINSRMSQGERYDQFQRAKEGKVSIMIGPRSALFTPFSNIGLIVIDEEHENAYKSDSVPKYHARETAIMRAAMTDATVILGSATPSIDSFYKAKKNEYMLHRMDERVESRELPQVHIVDLRQELKSGNRSPFSHKLIELMKQRLDNGQQIMLFVNRRGYANFVSCRECGTVIKCPHCDVSLTFHKSYGNDYLKCHYCGFEKRNPDKCPECGSKYMGKFGIGTETIQSKVQEIFPEARVLRMDMDTTSDKSGHERILSAFSNQEADILVGTQMIVKGHDFPNVTLVGVVAADMSLYASDYRAAERTFQLLTQAAGRAGRGELKGEVVIQTYNPQEYSIVAAASQNYEEYYEEEMMYRKLMQYPPVYNMVAILITSQNRNLCEKSAKDISGRIQRSNIDGLAVIGASEAVISKINDIYRYVIYLKHKDYDKLVYVKDGVERYIEMVPLYKEKINVQFDFTPLNNY